jgi:hypothetical protein
MVAALAAPPSPDAVVLPYVPANLLMLDTVQDDAPMTDVDRIPHNTHEDDDTAPLALLYLPAAQAVQTLEDVPPTAEL